MMFLCCNGHNWNARRDNPRKCPLCGSRYLYNIDIHQINPSSFTIQVLDGKNELLREAQVHCWQVLSILIRFREDFKGCRIKVFQNDSTNPVTGRMGIAVPEKAIIGNIYLRKTTRIIKDEIRVNNCRIRLEYKFKDTSIIHLPKRDKNTGKWVYKSQEYSVLVFEVYFILLNVSETTFEEKRAGVYKKCLNPLKDLIEKAGAELLFIEHSQGSADGNFRI